MRNTTVMVCALLVAGCASTPSPDEAPSDLLPSVAIYDVAPPNALPLGPVKASICDGTREMVTRRLQDQAFRLGGNGLTQLVCRDEGISLTCWKSMECNAVAVTVPPPPPPRPVPPPKSKAKPKPKPKPKPAPKPAQ